MVDIQSLAAEIRRGKKRKKKPQGKNIMSASAAHGGHSNQQLVICILTAVYFGFIQIPPFAQNRTQDNLEPPLTN